MSDRELELASKAVGIDGPYIENDEWYGTGILTTDENDCSYCWNPRDDDGEAFRLSNAMGFNVYHVNSTVYVEDLDSEIEIREDHRSNINKATRHAILRAAAKIGEGME